jgi:holo-[acyl-carrier protein] synthase
VIVGVDVTHVERIRSLFDRYPHAEMRFFTESERSHCHGHSDPMIHFAGTFAAKEAVIKTLRLGRAAAWARRVEVLRDEVGAPTARVRDGRFPGEIMVSISHDGSVAIAVAIAPQPKADGEQRPQAPAPRSVGRSFGRAKNETTLQPNSDLGRFLGPHVNGESPTSSRLELTVFSAATCGSDFP